MDIVSYLLGKNAGGGGGGGGSLQELNVTPTDQEQVLLPEEGYVGFSQVTVAAIQPPVVPPEAGALVSLVVGTLPKVSYVEGDPLDLTGCVILANYSNGYQYDVTAYCTFTANDPVTFSDTGIVVTFETQTLTIPITVAGVPVEAPAETKGLWHFDDGTDKNEVNGKGTSTSGLVNPQTIYFGVGKFGAKSLKPVSNAYFNYNNSLRLSSAALPGANITVEFWFKLLSPSGYVYLDLNFGSEIRINTGTSGVITFSNLSNMLPGASNKTMPYDSNWHHLAWVINNGFATLYIDGLKFAEAVSSFSSGSLSTFRVSQTTSGGNNALVDEVLITESVKYVTDFEPPYAPYYLASQGGE